MLRPFFGMTICRGIIFVLCSLINVFSAKLQNTPPLICISLNKNRLYCIKSRSSKDAA